MAQTMYRGVERVRSRFIMTMAANNLARLPRLLAWGLGLRQRIGFKRAAIAVARKLAVIMHAMLKSGQSFQREAEPMA